jgi:hypothetical protein
MPTSSKRVPVFVLLALACLASAAAVVPAQWTVWSHGTPCSDSGVPALAGTGPLSPGSTNTVQLTGAPADQTCFMVLGFATMRLPFAGGIMGPKPDILVPILTDASGQWQASFVWPDVPFMTMLWFQVWFPEPSASPPWCSSNTLRATGI